MSVVFKQTLQKPSFISSIPNFNLRNFVSFLVQKRCLNTSSTIPHLQSTLPEITKDSNLALQFLTNTCGLPLKSAISVSHKFHFQEKNEKKILSVIDYFKDEGFTQTHISNLIQKHPAVLRLKVETSLKPKVEFLKQNGIVGEFLLEFLVKAPTILNRSLASQVKPCFELLKSYLKSDDKVVFAMRRSSWLLTSNFKTRMQPNIEFLVKEGVPSTSVAKIIGSCPRSIEKEHSRIIYTVNALKNLGFQPTSPMFVHAFNVMISLSESTWKKKLEFLQSIGWTEMDVLTAFKIFPQMMGYSQGRIRKSMEFYQNTMKLDLQTIITHPTYFSYAIDTRVRPRYIVLKILKSKKLIKEDMKILPLFSITEEAFLHKYVFKFKDNIPGLLDIYSAGKTAEKVGS